MTRSELVMTNKLLKEKGQKYCNKCEQELNKKLFTSTQSWCKSCFNKSQIEKRSNDPTALKKQRVANIANKRKLYSTPEGRLRCKERMKKYNKSEKGIVSWKRKDRRYMEELHPIYVARILHGQCDVPMKELTKNIELISLKQKQLKLTRNAKNN